MQPNRYTMPKNYKLFISTFSLLLLINLKFVSAQGECLTGGCAISTDQWPPGTTLVTTSTTFTTATSTMNAGQYSVCQVDSLVTYEFSLCPADGGFNNLGYDAEMSLFNNFTDAFLCYSNDFCSGYPKIRWQATFNGAVNVQLNETNCTDNSTSTKLVWRVYDPGTSIAAIQNQEQMIELFPNPATNYLKVKSVVYSNTAKIFIYNALGELVMEQLQPNHKNLFELNISALKNGIYTLHYSDRNTSTSSKFVKVN